jgi:hypothetical protein
MAERGEAGERSSSFEKGDDWGREEKLKIFLYCSYLVRQTPAQDSSCVIQLRVD